MFDVVPASVWILWFFGSLFSVLVAWWKGYPIWPAFGYAVLVGPIAGFDILLKNESGTLTYAITLEKHGLSQKGCC